MSQSQQSFTSTSPPHPYPYPTTANNPHSQALQESLALLQQKGVIIEKYMQKVSLLQSKIEQLVVEIERLNWENREKQYRDQYIRRVRVKELVEEGFVEEMVVGGGGEREGEGEGGNTGEGEEESNGKSNGLVRVGEGEQGVRKLVVRIILSPDAEEILLTDKMQLFKDNNHSIHTSPFSLINGNTTPPPKPSSPIKQNNLQPPQQSPQQIHQYCQSVLQQITQMKTKLQLQQTEKLNQMTQLQEQNNLLLASRNKLQQLLEESKVMMENESFFKGREMENLKRQNQLLERDNAGLKEEVRQKQLRVDRLEGEAKEKSETLEKERKQLAETIQGLKKQLGDLQAKSKEQMSQKQQLLTTLQHQLSTLTQAQAFQQQKQQQILKLSQTINQHKLKNEHDLLSKNEQIKALQRQLKDIRTKHEDETHQYVIKIENKSKEVEDLKAKCDGLKQEIVQKFKMIQGLEEQVSKLTQQLLAQQQQSSHLQNLVSSTSSLPTSPPKINIIHPANPSAYSQTDAQLIFDRNFLRQTKEKVTPFGLQQYKICLPPSLDIINFDFDNSMSSQAQNVSNLSMGKNTTRQIYSNLSSSEFSRNDRHLDEMHTTNIVKVVEEKKASSEQKIEIPKIGENEEKPKSSRDVMASEDQQEVPKKQVIEALKQIRLKPKVASYSERNIIVEDPNEDDDLNDFKKKSKTNIFNINPYSNRVKKSEHSDDLIPSRSNISSSDEQNDKLDSDDDFADAIKDRDPELMDSDHPSETYKNSLKLPFGHSSSGGSEQLVDYTSYELSKSLPFGQRKYSSPASKEIANKATQLLELKSPQNIMKTILQKSFPIQKNPFKLSSSYMNVNDVLKDQKKSMGETAFLLQNKSNPGSDSLVNILIESHQAPAIILDTLNIDEVKRSSTDKDKTLSNRHELLLTPGTQGEGNGEEGEKGEGNNGERQDNFLTPKKREMVELAESLNFQSLKQIEKENNNKDSKSKKKHKIIYLRR